MTRLWTIAPLAALIVTAACAKNEPPAEQAAPAAETAAAPASAPAAPAASAPAPAAPRAASPRPAARPAEPPRAAAPRDLANTAATPVAREPAPARPTSHEVTVASGTELPIELLTALSSETAAVETEVRGRLRQAITVNGETVIPNGATLTGTVTEVERSGRVQGLAHMTVRFTEVSFSGERHRITTDPLSFEAESTKKQDATKIGAGAGIGAVIGGILGGGKGAAKGAAIGGAAGGGAVLATRGKEVELASGSTLTPVLSAPLMMTIEN